MSRFAFDIETVSPDVPHDEKPNFTDPRDFEFLISAVGYQPTPDAEIETELFFRDGWTPEAELEVIESTLDWFDARTTGDDTLYTYNGERFDLHHLQGRASIASTQIGVDGVVDRVETFIADIEHVDIQHDAKHVYGGYPTLEDVCFKNNVPVDRTHLSEYGIAEEPLNETRSSRAWGTSYLVNEDVPVLGEDYLDAIADGETGTEAFENIRAAFDHYARADIEPLFQLADARPFAPTTDAR